MKARLVSLAFLLALPVSADAALAGTRYICEPAGCNITCTASGRVVLQEKSLGAIVVKQFDNGAMEVTIEQPVSAKSLFLNGHANLICAADSFSSSTFFGIKE